MSVWRRIISFPLQDTWCGEDAVCHGLSVGKSEAGCRNIFKDAADQRRTETDFVSKCRAPVGNFIK